MIEISGNLMGVLLVFIIVWGITRIFIAFARA